MPVRLKVGEHLTLHIPDNRKGLKDILNIGFSDGFMREHFSGKKSRNQLRKYILTDEE